MRPARAPAGDQHHLSVVGRIHARLLPRLLPRRRRRLAARVALGRRNTSRRWLVACRRHDDASSRPTPVLCASPSTATHRWSPPPPASSPAWRRSASPPPTAWTTSRPVSLRRRRRQCPRSKWLRASCRATMPPSRPTAPATWRATECTPRAHRLRRRLRPEGRRPSSRAASLRDRSYSCATSAACGSHARAQNRPRPAVVKR
mmetsp:Transcript_28432/g.83844  ORF Transcript_28432/g.83844 Transcript_28432/m.83844 type:complete len:203 (-) Transcript_28432:75-683(-)